MQVGIFLYYAEMKSSEEQQKNLDLSTKEGDMISEAENSNVETRRSIKWESGAYRVQFQISDLSFVTAIWYVR